MKLNKVVNIILVAVLLSATSFAYAERRGQIEEIDVIADALFARPLGIVGTAVGAVGFIVTLPFSAIGGNAGEVGEMFVKEPFMYTVNRPLGHFDDNY